MLNAFSVDLEDWFNPSNLRQSLRLYGSANPEIRVEKGAAKILSLLTKHSYKATFFVLGWIAEKKPRLISQIESEGHEIAIHGYDHTPVTEMTPEQFRSDIGKTLEIVFPLIRRPVEGYRAPAFSITEKTLWALDILKEFGLRYDSSIFPYSGHPEYGISDFPLGISRHPNGLVELPMTCLRILGKRIPVSGGGYFRLIPYGIYKRLIQRTNNTGRPLIFYIHPWELDPGHPRLKLRPIDKFRHYNNIEHTESRLDRLLSDFEFTSVRQILQGDNEQ